MRRLRTWTLALLALALPAGAEGPADPFAALALRAVRARAGLDTLRVLHLGDSHAGSRAYVATWRAYLQAQFGDGGHGYGLPWAAAAAPRCGRSPGWRLFQPTLRNGSDGFSGPGGAYLEAHRAGERAWVEAGFRRLRLHLLRRPGGGLARIRVDGREVALVDLDGPLEPVLVQPDLPGEGRRVELECLRGPVRILGIALENGPGACHAALGSNGAQAAWLLRSEPAVLEPVLRREAPDLLVLAFGTNEASLRDFEPEAYRKVLRAVLERFRTAAPQAALLLLGPPDAVLSQGRPGALVEVTRIQAELARQAGALFLGQQEAMGGTGSIQAWAREGLALRDRVHFAPEGYARLARAGASALLERLGNARLPAGALQEPALAKAQRGAFALPAQAPKLLGRLETPAAEPSRTPRPIYTFRQEDGRLFITDDPAKVEGLRGSWVGRGPQ